MLEFINEYYISYRQEYAKQDHNGYKTIKNILTDKNITDHLNGRYAIAIKVNKASKFLGLDLDIKELDKLETVYDSLLCYFRHENILITDSGLKGFHIDIFFTDMISILELKKLYTVILEDTGISSDVLEARGHNNQAYKLPFGIHQKTGNRCNVVNHFGVSKEFEKPQKIDSEDIKDIISINYESSKYNPLNKFNIDSKQKEQELKNSYIYGIKAQKQRHKKTYNVIMYFKEFMNYNQAENYKITLKWIKEQLKENKKYINSNIKTIEKELKASIKSIYSNDSKIITYRSDIKLTPKDIEEITSVSGENKQRIYFVLYFYGKSFQATTKDNKGSFYCSYRDISRLSGIKFNKTIKKYIDELVKEKKIEIIYRERHQTTIYRIKNLQTTTKEDYIIKTKINKNKRVKDYFKIIMLSYNKYQKNKALKKNKKL